MAAKKISNFVVFFLILTVYQTLTQPPLVVNLSEAKKAIKEYYAYKYNEDMDSIIADAIWQVKNLKLNKNSAFVFDVDETALSNFEYEINYDFGYIKKEWDKWVMSEKATAIKQVKQFYDTLISMGIKVIFITGRTEEQFQATYNNLVKASYSKFDTLICRTKEDLGKTAKEFKSQKRKELTEKFGYNIIGTIGDQWSDHDGGYTIIKVKLPNYLYKVE